MREADTLEQTWDKFREGDIEAKNALFEHYYPLVEKIARKLSKTLPSNVEVDDLIGDGVFGLLEAIERFDPSKGYKLETYAVSRIRGEMYDRLRAADWVPRALRTKAKKVDAASTEFELEHHRKPTDLEVAELCGLTEEEVREAISLVLGYSRVTIDASVNGVGETESISVYDTVGDSMSNTSENYDSVELMEVLARAMKRLTSRERVVMVLYYCEDHTLQKIGDLLSVTESRACQIHNRALLSLRSMCIDLS
jgi:RNA polymerase sigma factor FliA